MSDAKQHRLDEEYDMNRSKRERLEECAADTNEEVLSFGKYKGKTVSFVMKKEPSYIGWAFSKGLIKGLDRNILAIAHDAFIHSEVDGLSDWSLKNGYF